MKIREVKVLVKVLPRYVNMKIGLFMTSEEISSYNKALENVKDTELPDPNEFVEVQIEMLRDMFYSKATLKNYSLTGGVDKWIITKQDFNKLIIDISQAKVLQYKEGEE